MPARFTRARARRIDENVAPEPKNPVKSSTKSKKPVRVPLADRTNSASDENTSIGDVEKKSVDADATMRPRRALRAPAWLSDHQLAVPQRKPKDVTPKKAVQYKKKKSDLKTPGCIEYNETQQRPRRVLRLSSHSLSPSKFVPIAPTFASTPLKMAQSNTRNKMLLSKLKNIDKSDTNNNPTSIKNKGTVRTNTTNSKKNSPEIKQKLAIYEFTYDPSEEPKISKKKIRKQTVKKKAACRRVVLKDNYAKNVDKQLESLKSIISKKTVPQQDTAKPVTVSIPVKEIDKNGLVSNVNTVHANSECVQTSDEAAPPHDSEQWDDHPLSYSPAPTTQQNQGRASTNKDPLNLIEELSFFDEVPIASSSMICRRSAVASPWRVDLDVHYKYPTKTFVKSNMTPALESSFTNVKPAKQHKYSGIFAESAEACLKQTSILSFIKEKAQKSQKKSISPTKINTVFDHSSGSNTVNTTEIENDRTPNKSNDFTHKNAEAIPSENQSPHKKSEKYVKGVTEFFGFDECSPAKDQENISPKQKKMILQSKHVLRNKNRAGLSERNQQKPMRLTTAPSKVFAPTSGVVNKLYEELKSAKDMPVFPNDEAVKANQENKSIETSNEEAVPNEDEIEPHLFEDIEVVHHKKVERRSYGKTRKVTFQQSPQPSDASDLSEDDNDSIYSLPVARPKRKAKSKPKKKNELTSKESEEAERWVDKFNSMIEEVEEFPLLIE